MVLHRAIGELFVLDNVSDKYYFTTMSRNRFRMHIRPRTRLLFYISLAVLLIPDSAAFPQISRPLRFSFDVTPFRGPGGSTRYELYYTVPIEQLRFRRRGDIQRTSLMIRVQVTAGDETLHYGEETFTLEYGDREPESDRYYLGMIPFQVTAEFSAPMLNIRMELDNPESRRLGRASMSFPARNFYGDQLMLSGLQMASSVTPAEDTDVFTKNGLRIVPYPLDTHVGRRTVYVYFELYNLRLDSFDKCKYRVRYTVQSLRVHESAMTLVDEWGNIISRPMATRAERITAESYAEHEGPHQFEFTSVDLSRLEPGNYEFVVDVYDEMADRWVSEQSRFTLGR